MRLYLYKNVLQVFNFDPMRNALPHCPSTAEDVSYLILLIYKYIYSDY